jgi:hypothetical protein
MIFMEQPSCSPELVVLIESKHWNIELLVQFAAETIQNAYTNFRCCKDSKALKYQLLFQRNVKRYAFEILERFIQSCHLKIKKKNCSISSSPCQILVCLIIIYFESIFLCLHTYFKFSRNLQNDYRW